MTRGLAPEERALWAKVAASVKPLHRAALPDLAAVRAPVVRPVAALRVRPAPSTGTAPASRSNDGLDGSWDRRLARGLVRPDLTIDLHGHSLATAHAALDRRLEQAFASGARVVLLITGKPPSSERRPIARGAIRAAVGDWLQASRHAGGIAAIRGAHPRHGGTGALYLILRRNRPTHWPKS